MMRISQDLDDKSKHLKGDIHFIADAPLLIHIYREETFQRYRTNMTALHLDSTGSITKKVGKTEPYYYALVAEGTGTAGQSFPLAHMISERHNVPTIAHFLMQVRSDFRLANGGTAELQRSRIITDCSWALMHAVSTAFNQMSLPIYLDACWKSALEAPEIVSTPSTLLSLCTAHISHQVSSAITVRLGRKKRSERQQLMWLFGRMQQAATVGELDQLFECMCKLLLSQTTPDLTMKVHLAKEETEEAEEDQRPPVDTTVRWQSYRQSTEAGKHFDDIKRNVEQALDGIPQDQDQDESNSNSSFCPSLMDYMLSSVMPLAPLYAQLVTDVPASNACVESWMKTMKHQLLQGKKRLPPGEVVEVILRDATARRKQLLIPPRPEKKRRKVERTMDDAEETWKRPPPPKKKKTTYLGKTRKPSGMTQETPHAASTPEPALTASGVAVDGDSAQKERTSGTPLLASDPDADVVDVDALPSPEPSVDVHLRFGNTSVYARDVDGLTCQDGVWGSEVDAWLTASVISADVLSLANASCLPVTVFEATTLPLMRQLALSKALRSNLEDQYQAHLSDGWIVPFNLDSYTGLKHWVLFIVQHRKKLIVFLDPLGHQPPPDALSDVMALVEVARHPRAPWTEWQLVVPEKTMRQEDGRSCGVILCLHVEALCSGRVPRVPESKEAKQRFLDDGYRREIQRRLRKVRQTYCVNESESESEFIQNGSKLIKYPVAFHVSKSKYKT